MQNQLLDALSVDTRSITHFVSKYFDIQSVVTGGPRHGFHVRYVGHLSTADSETAYN